MVPHRLEQLESRIAPAVVIVNPHLARYFDVDGDLVTITVDKGSLQPGDFVTVPAGIGEQLQLVDFSGQAPQFDDVSLSITADPSARGGNGSVDVGKIDGDGVRFRSIVVDGDLGDLQAGNGRRVGFTLGRLEVGSLGVAGLGTQAPGGDLSVEIRGPVGSILVHGDSSGSFSVFANRIIANIHDIHIEGSIVGLSDVQPGSISAVRIGKLRVDGNIEANGLSRGNVDTAEKAGDYFVGGSIIGGSLNGQRFSSVRIEGSLVGTTFEGGYINDNNPESFPRGISGPIYIGGSIIGGPGGGGFIVANGLSTVTVRGDIIGDSSNSGYVSSAEIIQRIDVGGSVIGHGAGGGVISTARLIEANIEGDLRGGPDAYSGLLYSAFYTRKVHIGGSIVGGAGGLDPSQYTPDIGFLVSGAIFSFGTIGQVVIDGDLQGGDGLYSGTIAVAAQTGTERIYIDTVRIGGSIIGGDGDHSGTIYQGLTAFQDGAEIGLRHLVVRGSILGGDGESSGGATATFLGKIRVDGDVRGGDGLSSGSIASYNTQGFELFGSLEGGAGFLSGSASNLTVGVIHGSVTGGTDTYAGRIAMAPGGRLLIEGNLLGGTAPAAGSLLIHGTEAVVIKGSLVRGTIDFGRNGDGRAGLLRISGDIIGNGTFANVPAVEPAAIDGDNLDRLEIGGSVLGATIRLGSAEKVVIRGDLAARGLDPGILEAANRALDRFAFREIVIGGSVDHSLIRTFTIDAGRGLPVRIAKLVIGGNLTASSIAVGVEPGPDGRYGTLDDDAPGTITDEFGLRSQLGLLQIQGRVSGSPASGDHYGIVAEEIVRAIVRGRALPLTPGPYNDSLSLDPAAEVTLREVRP